MSDPKYIDIKEFREKGYLFEANRMFFHPLGLALEIKFDEAGNETLGGIWDYRDDPEGMLYDDNTMKSEVAKKKALHVNKELSEKALVRKKKYGYIIQPLENS
ncbi:hypothetical protein M3664_04845 [Paenibacillus lautus]|uniref:hypothetical protein n=1 Tax=Paenibacillus lautus TaxID=1401 RepID=UPI00203F0299|nr:hypothetical protein [Paenibacillus lautus]MCM3257110.1 hypothetical protein [Paenibacillus lautus]